MRRRATELLQIGASMDSKAHHLERPSGALPVRRGTSSHHAAILARAATQSMFVFGEVSWSDGWTGRVDAATVTIFQDGAIMLRMPIYEAARLKLEDDEEQRYAT